MAAGTSIEENVMGSKIDNEIYSFGYRKPRYRTGFRVLLQMNGYPPRLVDALCVDVSEDGLAAEVAENIAIGDQLTVVMTPPESSVSVRLSAKVVNRNDYHYGFIFHFASQAERDSLRAYLASIRPEPISLGRSNQPEPPVAPKTKR
ncbi:MAG TPA: PilZ domain-containing protein [Terriglobales bacterium]